MKNNISILIIILCVFLYGTTLCSDDIIGRYSDRLTRLLRLRNSGVISARSSSTSNTQSPKKILTGKPGQGDEKSDDEDGDGQRMNHLATLDFNSCSYTRNDFEYAMKDTPESERSQCGACQNFKRDRCSRYTRIRGCN